VGEQRCKDGKKIKCLRKQYSTDMGEEDMLGDVKEDGGIVSEVQQGTRGLYFDSTEG
jgi:hypothetical protein